MEDLEAIFGIVVRVARASYTEASAVMVQRHWRSVLKTCAYRLCIILDIARYPCWK